MSSLPHPRIIRKLPPLSLKRKRASLPLGRDPLAGPPPPATQKRGPSNFSRKKRGLPLSRHEGTSFSFCQGRELLAISSSSSSKHGRELTVKNNGFQTSNLDKRSLFLSRCLQKDMKSVGGKRREPHYLLVSRLSVFRRMTRPHSYERTQPLPAFKNNA